MNKTEIIHAVAYADVPDKTTSVEHTVGPELVISHFPSGEDMGGLAIITARMFEDLLKYDTAELDEMADAKLFERLHQTCIEFNEGQIEAFTVPIDILVGQVISSHRKVIGRLQEIAKELGISYTVPEDPLLSV